MWVDVALVIGEIMKPTQAQIEAAWIQNSNLAEGGFGRVMRVDQFKDAIKALTAAAEVGEQDLAGSIRAENERIARVKAATIERCAQVAEQQIAKGQIGGMIKGTDADADWGPRTVLCHIIAAAIRAMKEEGK